MNMDPANYSQPGVHYTLGTLDGLVRVNMFTSVRFLIIQLISLKLNSSFHWSDRIFVSTF